MGPLDTLATRVLGILEGLQEEVVRHTKVGLVPEEAASSWEEQLQVPDAELYKQEEALLLLLLACQSMPL